MIKYIKTFKEDAKVALIKCPECGKEISNKSTACVNCGFPLNIKVENNTLENICTINGIQYDLSDIMQEVNNFYSTHPNPTIDEDSTFGLYLNRKIRQLTGINDIAGATLSVKITSSKSIPKTFNSSEYPDPVSFDKSKIYCPRCGSTAITTGARGVNWTLGLIGAGKTVNRCGKCGHTWQPK